MFKCCANITKVKHDTSNAPLYDPCVLCPPYVSVFRVDKEDLDVHNIGSSVARLEEVFSRAQAGEVSVGVVVL